MKTLITFILFITAISTCTAQTFASLVAFVYDKDNNTPISGASVIVKEAGWAAKTTGSDGKAFFDKSMPIGEINYIVSKEGYQGQEGKFNITTEEKSNTLDVKLTKFQDDKLLITGEVVDENNNDFEDVIIEAKIANIIKTTKTDQSGNYSIEFILNQIKYDVSTIQIEVKCPNSNKKTNEDIGLTKRNIINKNFKINCETPKPIQEKPQGPTPEEIRKVKEEQDRLELERQRNAEAQRIQSEKQKKEEREKELFKTVQYIISIIQDNHSGVFSNRTYSGYTKDCDGWDGKIRFESYFMVNGESRDSYNDYYRDFVEFELQYIGEISKTNCGNGYCGIKFDCINTNCISRISHFNGRSKISSFTLNVKCDETTQTNLLDAFLKYKRLVNEK